MKTESPVIITVKTTVNAPIEKVWSCWSGPEHITKWCEASDDWHAPYAENDLRTGGKFKTTMAAKDGSNSFDFEGVYTNVVDKKLIEYTLGDERKVKIIMQDNGDSTVVTESFEAEKVNTEELQRGGWQAILDNFKKYTEAQ